MNKLKPDKLKPDKLITNILALPSLHNLPEELLIELIKNSNLDSIKQLCKVNKYAENFCKTEEFRNILISKIPYGKAVAQSLDISEFTVKELYLYSKVVPLKKKIYMDSNVVIVLDNNNLYEFNLNDGTKKVISNTNINQITHKKLVILYNNGKLNTKNEFNKIINITSHNHYINIFTASGKAYRTSLDDLNESLYIKEFPVISNIIQIKGQYILTANGDLYIGDNSDRIAVGDKIIKISHLGKHSLSKPYIFTKVPNLPGIIKINHLGYALTNTQKIFKLVFNSLPLTINNWINMSLTYPSLNNIISMETSSNGHYAGKLQDIIFLNDIGDVFILKTIKKYLNLYSVKTLSNILEISYYGDNIAALDNKRNLIIGDNKILNSYNLDELDQK